MKKIAIILLFCGICISTGAQQIRSVTVRDIQAWASNADTTYVINFWATWCVPCVQELPEFNELFDHAGGKPIRIMMVSLDFKDAYPMKLEHFLRRKPLKPEVCWLAETNPNSYVPAIDDAWEGSIPATLVIRPGKGRRFVEGQVTYRKLKDWVSQLSGN